MIGVLKGIAMEIEKVGVKVVTGVNEIEQERLFANATLQRAGKMIAVSIATYVEIPEEVAFAGEDAVARFLARELSAVARNAQSIEFDVRVGLSEEAVKQRRSNQQQTNKIFAVK